MERSDFWTHVGLMIATVFAVILPGYLAKGFADTMIVYFIGVVAVIALAGWSRWRTIRFEQKGM